MAEYKTKINHTDIFIEGTKRTRLKFTPYEIILILEIGTLAYWARDTSLDKSAPAFSYALNKLCRYTIITDTSDNTELTEFGRSLVDSICNPIKPIALYVS